MSVETGLTEFTVTATTVVGRLKCDRKMSIGDGKARNEIFRFVITEWAPSRQCTIAQSFLAT